LGYLALSRYEFLKARGRNRRSALFVSRAERELGEREDCFGVVARFRKLVFSETDSEKTRRFSELWR
jgi:hypothetical protein